MKQAETKSIFSERVQARALLVRDEHGDAIKKDLKDCFLEEAVDVLGGKHGISRKIEIWRWNEEVAALVKEKQLERLFKLWKGPKKSKKGCRCMKTGG